MQRLIAIYRYCNLLSLDVAIGAVCTALFFADVLHVNLLPYGLISLGLSVWIIYTTDHLLDAWKTKSEAATARHKFHQKHFKLLFVFLSLAIVSESIVLLFIRKPVFIAGVAVVSFVGIYFLINPYLKFIKELFIAVLYTIGVLLPSIALTPLSVADWPWLLIICFFLTALINLILFSWFDYENDRRDKASSFATIVGRDVCGVVISSLFAIAVMLCCVVFLSDQRVLMILLMNVFLLVTFVCDGYFSTSDRFRLAGDSVFYLPLFYFLF